MAVPRSAFLTQLVGFVFVLAATGCGAEPEVALENPLDASDAAGGLDASRHRADAGRSREAAAPGEQDAGEAPAASELRSTLITVAGRPVQGKRVGDSHAFLGIPYAKPPLGARRFAPPEPVEPGSATLDATSFGAVCPQAPTRGMLPGPDLPEREDCLLLHVWVPARASREPLPVMMFVHGGRFTLGSGADLDGQFLSARQDVIVVSINYRLGPLGWIVHPDLDLPDAPSGNYGLRDQQLALRWVHDHIADFGGDPRNVTLFGQSAGGQSACYHLFARGSEGLFQRIIMESGTCVDYPALPLKRSSVQVVGKLLADTLCPGAADVASCLRAQPVDKLTHWTRAGLPGPMGEDFNPQVDGKLLEVDPWQALAAGDFQKVPMLMGTQTDEWGAIKLYGGADAPRPTNNLELALVAYGLYPDDFADILSIYAPPGAADSGANDALGRILSNSWFHCPARTLARGASAHGVPVYLYQFSLAPSVHGQELDYVFGYPWLSGLLKEPLFTPPAPLPLAASLVETVQRSWGQFARAGTPNVAGLSNWPAYEVATDRHQDLNLVVSTGSGLHSERCAYWDSVWERRHAAAP